MFAASLISTKVDAQIKVGPVAGINFSDATGDINTDGMLIRFHFGALVNFGISHYFMVEPQVLYSLRGLKGSGSDIKMDYIEIPVWLRYQLSSGLNFNAGPYAGILLSAKVEDTNVKSGFNTFDFGLGGGIGYQTGSGFGFALNYSQGFANILDDDNSTARNSCIKISASYTLGGRRE